VFGFEVPVHVPDVDSKLLDPRSTWTDPEAYDRKAADLAGMFRDNFDKFTADGSTLAAVGPCL
jgi:phosphoenolpyruvate carboxykinase (ATP)